MATLAHTVSRILPRPVYDWARPKWYFLREIWELYAGQGGSIRRLFTQNMGDGLLRRCCAGK